MRVLIIGAAGYLGWETKDYLEKQGHKVFGIDNFSKQRILEGSGIHWFRGKRVHVDWVSSLSKQVEVFEPDCVIHYGEQCSAPFSMISEVNGIGTINGNLNSTLDLIYQVKAQNPDIHIIKLGTMGEYGTPNIDIEEGWIDISHNGRTDRMLYPKKPHSIYHLSKVFDSDALAFACRVWGLRVTDLNQGFVYGIGDAEVKTNFYYDAIFGTVLNRFVAQSVVGHPLTVYGKGGQTRGCLNIRDTVRCVELAMLNPANRGEFRVMNQFVDQVSVNQVADLVFSTAKQMGLNPKIAHIDNPRDEAEDHYYNAKNTKLLDLGLKPHYLTEDSIAEMIEYLLPKKGEIVTSQILPTVRWK